MPEEITGDEDDKNVLEFVQIGTICAIPADKKSPDTVNFVKIIVHCTNDSDDQIMTDDISQTIVPSHIFIGGRYYLHQFCQHTLKTKGTLFQGKYCVPLCSTCWS